MSAIVLSRAAGEEGAPTELGEVRDSRCRTHLVRAFPHLPVAFRNGSLLLPLKKRETT
jgi:hypothetical protein